MCVNFSVCLCVCLSVCLSVFVCVPVRGWGTPIPRGGLFCCLGFPFLFCLLLVFVFGL